jgi:hypothetical protein
MGQPIPMPMPTNNRRCQIRFCSSLPPFLNLFLFFKVCPYPPADVSRVTVQELRHPNAKGKRSSSSLSPLC